VLESLPVKRASRSLALGVRLRIARSLLLQYTIYDIHNRTTVVALQIVIWEKATGSGVRYGETNWNLHRLEDINEEARSMG
jgi:hypothetical protein